MNDPPLAVLPPFIRLPAFAIMTTLTSSPPDAQWVEQILKEKH